MRPFRFTLRFVLLSAVALLLVLTWALASLISFHTSESGMIAEKNDQARLVLASVVTMIEMHAEQEWNAEIERFASRLSSEKDLDAILVVDQYGKVSASIGRKEPSDLNLQKTLKEGGEGYRFSGDRRLLNRYAPIHKNGAVVGAVRLTLSLEKVHERIAWSRHLYLAYFVLDFLLLLGFGSYLLSRVVVTPLDKLLAATERIAEGDLHHRLPTLGSREFADLADAYNLMLKTLKDKDDAVERHVLSLEAANRELRLAREETLRSEKLASVGLLAAVMAHEIGTPLAAILGYASILQEEQSLDQVSVDYVSRIGEDASRIDRLVRDLLDYARPRQPQLVSVDLSVLLTETVDLLQGQGALKKISVLQPRHENLPSVHADRHQLQQVLINLLINARDAMPDGGSVTINVCTHGYQQLPVPQKSNGNFGRRRDDRLSCHSAKAADIRWLQVSIADTGIGISPENIPKIFDPFFTTKDPGKGTGLGLAICSRIIDSFGGYMTVSSTVGEGTTFLILLPAEDAE